MGVTDKINTFYYFDCQNQLILDRKNSVLERIFHLLSNFDYPLDMKELLYQVLAQSLSYLPLTYLSHIFHSYKDLRICNLWHRFFLPNILLKLYQDTILSIRILSSLIKATIFGLHDIWLK